jgi:tetratricopeptide (TPR) repeat protein
VSGWRVARLSEIPARDGWIPIRDHFGIDAFGINAWRGAAAENSVIGEHAEDLTGHEELYVVLEGRATFTIAGEEIDAPVGTIVFVSDPSARRGAVAREPGTAVLSVGGRPGEAFAISLWERTWQENRQALDLYNEGRYAEAADVVREALRRHPEHPTLHYNLACFETKAGRPAAEILPHLRRAIELDPRFREYARGDSDFDAIRAEPGFTEIVDANT